MSYERIGDTKYVDGKKFTLVAQTERHRQFVEKNSVPGASKLHPALRKPRWEIDNDTVQKNKWALAQKKEIENLKKNIDFIFTMDDYKNYVNAIMYLQENLGTTVTGEYDIRTAQFIFSLLKERYKEISPYLKYHGAFGFPHVYGVDKNLWGMLGLDKKYLVGDSHKEWALYYYNKYQDKNEKLKEIYPVENFVLLYSDLYSMYGAAIVYFGSRIFFGILGDILLAFMDCPLSIAMYTHAFFGNGEQPSEKCKNLIIETIKNSKTFESKIDEITNNATGDSISQVSETLKFEGSNEKDLVYSIQECKMTYSGEKLDDGWHFHIIFSDNYDFTEWLSLNIKNDDFKKNLVNNYGVVMQLIDHMKPYYWYVEFDYRPEE